MIRVILAALIVAVYCTPFECRDDLDCDVGCYCIEGICDGDA